MNRSNRPLALAALTALLLADPDPATAVWETCFIHSGPLVLDGARLGAGTSPAAVELCRTLGFLGVAHDPGDDDVVVVPLKEGRLEWGPGTGGRWAMLGTRVVQPLATRDFFPIDQTPIPRWPDRNPYAESPNHAVRVVGVIGLVRDVKDGIANVGEQHPLRGGPDPIRFGRLHRLADLDCDAADAMISTGGSIRLIAARSADSPCAKWWGGGFGRWIGIILESDDLDATAQWFDDHGVPWRPIDRDRPGIAVDPEHTGGVLLEFVALGYRPKL